MKECGEVWRRGGWEMRAKEGSRLAMGGESNVHNIVIHSPSHIFFSFFSLAGIAMIGLCQTIT